MEVRIRRGARGCVYWPVVIMTFGLAAVLLPLGERHFIKEMDETGVLTRGGKRIAWNEFTSVERWQRKKGSFVISDEYLLKSPRGSVSLPTWRTEHAQEAVNYLFQHLPPHLVQGGR
jgi:hypothetical protein